MQRQLSSSSGTASAAPVSVDLPPEAAAHAAEVGNRFITFDEAARLLIEEFEKENPDWDWKSMLE